MIIHPGKLFADFMVFQTGSDSEVAKEHKLGHRPSVLTPRTHRISLALAEESKLPIVAARAKMEHHW